MRQHLAICPHCGTGENRRLKNWNNFSRMLKERFEDGGAHAKPPPPAAGQLRLVKHGLAHWHDSNYFNPPCVLVLEADSEMADEIFVAQVYHDISLAGPGDLILEGAGAGVEDVFVECWNTYTLKSSYLGPLIGTVTAEIVAAVKTLETRPDSLPDRAPLPAPLTEHDPRLYFRELEVEVGFTFASRAVDEILAANEKPLLDYRSVGELQEDIRKSAKVIRFPRPTADMEEILTNAKFPPEVYAKAAATHDRESVPANLVVLLNGKVHAFRSIQGFVISKMRTESSLNVSGAFPLIPDSAVNPRMICFYWSKATGAMVPGDMHWDVGTGHFYVKIRNDWQDDEVLEFALVFETEEEEYEG